MELLQFRRFGDLRAGLGLDADLGLEGGFREVMEGLWMKRVEDARVAKRFDAQPDWMVGEGVEGLQF